MRLPRIKSYGPLAAFGGIAFAILAILGTSYGIRSYGRYDYLTERNIRVLGIAARQIESSVEGTEEIIQKTYDQLNQSIPQEIEGKKCTDTLPEIQDNIQSIIRDRRERIGDPSLDAKLSCVKEYESAPQQKHTWLTFGDSRFTMTFEASEGKTPYVIRVDDSGQLSPVLSPFLVRGVFDVILLVDGNGNTVFQEGGNGFRLNKTRALNSSSMDSIEISGTIYKFFYHPLRSRYEIDTKGTPESNESGITRSKRALFGICGLVKASTFRAEALALSPFWLVTFLLSLLGLVLYWPFLKLKLIGPRERVRVADVIYLSLSVLLGSSLVVLLLLAAASFYILQDRTNQDLKVLAKNIASNFESEIGLALTVMNQADKSVRQEGSDFQAIREEASEKKELFQYPIFDVLFWVDSKGDQKVKWTGQKYGLAPVHLGDREYFKAAKENRLWTHNFENVPGINKGPHQEFFYVEPIRSKTTGKLQVAVAKRLSEAFEFLGPTNETVSCEIMGITIPAISVIRPVLPYGFGFAIVDENGKTLFHSRPERNLEENFVEESDDNAELKSAIVSRVDHGMTIQYWGRPNLAFITPLVGFPSWSVITFQEKGILRSMHADLLWVSAAFMIILNSIVLVICILLGAAALPRNGLKWLWLNPGTDRQYFRMTAAFLIIAIETFRIIISHPPDILLTASFSGSLTGVGLGVLILGENRKVYQRFRFVGLLGVVSWINLVFHADSPEESYWELMILSAALIIAIRPGVFWKILKRFQPMFHSSRADFLFRYSYISSRASAILLFSIIPTIGFFRYAQENQFTLIAQQQHLDMFHNLEEREQRVRAFGDTKQKYFKKFICWNPSSPQPIAPMHTRHSFVKDSLCDVYSGNLLTISYSASSGNGNGSQKQNNDWVQKIKDARLSILTGNQSFSSSQVLPDTKSGDSWHWENTPKLTFYHHVPRRHFDRDEFLSIESPPLDVHLWSHLSFWLLGILLMIGISILIRYSARRFFVLEFKKLPIVTLDELAQMRIKENLFVLCPPHCNKDPIRKAGEQQNFKVVEVERKTADRVQTLDAIEWNISRMKIVILSQVEPEYLLSDDEDIPDEKRLTEDLQRRWASLLRRFRRLIVTEANRTWFDRLLNRLMRGLSKRYPKKKKKIEELFSTLTKECGSHEQLQDIGKTLVRQANFVDQTPETLVRKVREAAECFYLAVWDALPNEEKLLLAQLSLGSLVNPKCERILQRLTAKGLISIDSSLAVMNRSFEQFILDTARLEDISHWEEVGSISVWRQVRPVIFIGTIVLAVFLLSTQQQLLGSFTAIAAVSTSMIPLLLRLLDLLAPSPIRQTK